MSRPTLIANVRLVWEDYTVCHKVCCLDGNQPFSQCFGPTSMDFDIFSYQKKFRPRGLVNISPIEGVN